MSMQLIIVLHIFGAYNINSQQCLSSPPELDWTQLSDVHFGNLTFNAKRFEATFYGYPTSFTTRVHNGILPSPTLRFERGQVYHLTLINNLGPENINNPTGYNIIKDVNTTNIHTHGLHISGETPADAVFDYITGGNSMTYEYYIPCDHAGGTFWYHPHHHGSTAIQVGGGAVGAIIVDDSPEEEGLPDWLVDMEELILIIQHIDLRTVRQIGRGLDNTFSTDALLDFWLLNGKYQPDICLTTGVWKRIRIVHADLSTPNEFMIDYRDVNDTTPSSCEIYLISRDGVLIHGNDNTVPRVIQTRKLYFSVASRADIAIRCNVDGLYEIKTSLTNGGNSIIGYIKVENINNIQPSSIVTEFIPIRPYYLHSLLNNNGPYNEETLTVQRLGITVDPLQRFAINNQLFNGSDNYLIEMESDSLQQWTITRNNHPMHIHINHFQVISQGQTGTDPNWTHIGDWLDVLDTRGTVRFRVDRFGGKVVIHCHILRHEDRGTMAVAKINGGCSASGGHIDDNASCEDLKYCDNPFFEESEESDDDDDDSGCLENFSACTSAAQCCSGRCNGNRNPNCRP